MSENSSDDHQFRIDVYCSHLIVAEAVRTSLDLPVDKSVSKQIDFVDAITNNIPSISPVVMIGVFLSDHEAESALNNLLLFSNKISGVRIIIIANSLKATILRAAMQNGVDAFLTTKVSTTVLKRTIELVLLGLRVLPSEMSDVMDVTNEAVKATDSVLEGSPPANWPAQHPPRTTALSSREHQILQHLMNGSPNKAIARELNITEATVKVHVKALLRKTQMTNRTQAAMWAVNSGIHSEAAMPATIVIDAPIDAGAPALGDLATIAIENHHAAGAGDLDLKIA